MTVAQVEIPEAEIAKICERNGIRKLALFGSVLTDSPAQCSSVFEESGRARGLSVAGELAEVPRHRRDIMADQDATVLSGFGQNDWIVKTLQRNCFSSPEVQQRGATERSCNDRVVEISVRLKPDLHTCFANKRCLTSSTRCWSSGLAGSAAPSNASHFFSSSRR